MRIGIITDAHANLPATLAAFNAMDSIGCDRIIHLGDVIDIGPHPREVMEVMLGREDLTLIMGNHDALFAFGMPDETPGELPDGEVAHARWTHDQLDFAWRDQVARWPKMIDETIGRTSVRFQHYALQGQGFRKISLTNQAEELDAIFDPQSDILFFGHHHPAANVFGRAHYVNPGALGCHPALDARFAILDASETGNVDISFHAVPYESHSVYQDLIERQVPEAALIVRMFLA